jgi:CubicO group peptidase (beta-lactamase class C family)
MFKPIVLFAACLLIAGCSAVPSIQKGQSLSEYLEAIDFSGSILISRNNEIIHSAGYGFANYELKVPNTPDTQFYIASLTKQFTSLAIMQLQEQGLLNINDSIDKFFPKFPHGSKITIKHLLTHSAGLYDFTDNWDEIKQLDLSAQDIVDRFKGKELDFEPGSKVRYSSSGYILAGQIIEQVSGMGYADYVESRIFKPLNMSHSSYGYSSGNTLNKAIGYRKGTSQKAVNVPLTYAAGALASSVTDFYLWDQSLYSSSLVNERSLQEIYPEDRSALGSGLGTGKFKVVMGLGWGIYETDFGPEYSHTGNVDGFSTVVSRYPNQKAMIVILSNQDRFDVFTLKNRIAKLVLENEKT